MLLCEVVWRWEWELINVEEVHVRSTDFLTGDVVEDQRVEGVDYTTSRI